jgi:hypothetical protein
MTLACARTRRSHLTGAFGSNTTAAMGSFPRMSTRERLGDVHEGRRMGVLPTTKAHLLEAMRLRSVPVLEVYP